MKPFHLLALMTASLAGSTAFAASPALRQQIPQPRRRIGTPLNPPPNDSEPFTNEAIEAAKLRREQRAAKKAAHIAKSKAGNYHQR